MRPIFDDRLQWPIVATLLRYTATVAHFDYRDYIDPFSVKYHTASYSGPFLTKVTPVPHCIVATVLHCYSAQCVLCTLFFPLDRTSWDIH